MKSVVKNYIAKIALEVILRHAKSKNPDFNIDEFISNLGELDLKDFELFDKYPVKDGDQFILGLKNETGGDKSFFLKIGLDGLASKFGSYSFFIQNTPNFRELLNSSSQFSHVVTDLINISNTEMADHTKVTYQFSRHAVKLKNETLAANIEMNFGAFSAMFNEISFPKDNRLVFYSAYSHELSDEDISDLLGHEFISNAQQNNILIPNEVLDAKNSRYEANLPSKVSHGLYKHLEAQNEGSLVSIISNLLEVKPSSSLDDISHQLHISKRTLQRRLKDQNINFSALKQSAANQRSLELLNSKEHSIEEITTLLGYSSTATFVHAFTKWQGVSPSAYLKQK